MIRSGGDQHACLSFRLEFAQAGCARRTRFWWDLAAWVPLDYIALFILGDLHAGASLMARVPLLRLLRLVRPLCPTSSPFEA